MRITLQLSVFVEYISSVSEVTT